MIIILIVIAIFALSSFAADYESYSKFYDIAYPDSMGFLGGAIFGFIGVFAFLPPASGTLRNASRREKGLFIFGLIWSIAMAAIIICVFAFDYEPEAHWTSADEFEWDD